VHNAFSSIWQPGYHCGNLYIQKGLPVYKKQDQRIASYTKSI